MGQIGFVDTISASPTVRLDLSDNVTWRVLLDRTDLSPAPLRRVSSSNFMSDGDNVSATSYGDRTVQLGLKLVTPDVDTVGGQVQALVHELDRPSNILRWWPDGATAPVFFETKRSPLGSIKQVLATQNDATVPVQAKPFALGLRQTLSTAVVSNDPATGCYVDIPYPMGDVETPLYLSFAAGDVIAAGRRLSVLAMRRRGTPGNAPWILQAESMTRAANTTLPGADAAMSGSGSNYARASSLTNLFVTRLTGTFGATPGVDVRGKSRFYARVRQTNGSGEVRVRLAISPDGTTELVPDPNGVVLPGGTAIRWVELPTVQLPIGDDPGTDGPGGPDLACRGIEVRLQIALTANSSNLDVDCLVGMPADDRLCRILWPGVTGPTSMVLDSSARPKVYGIGSSGETQSTQLRGLDSGTPMISPLAYNRMFLLLDAGTTSTAGDDITETTTVTPYYWPRYAYLRPPLS